MAGSFTNALELSLLDHVFGGSAYSKPATLYVGLSTTTPADDGTNVTEPSGNGYARVAVTNDSTSWDGAVGVGGLGTKKNKVAFEFPKATGSWGTVTYFFISTASTGGTILAYGSLTTPQAVATDNILKFPIGDLTITLD